MLVLIIQILIITAITLRHGAWLRSTPITHPAAFVATGLGTLGLCVFITPNWACVVAGCGCAHIFQYVVYEYMAHVEVVVRPCVAVVRIDGEFMTAEAVRRIFVVCSGLAEAVLE